MSARYPAIPEVGSTLESVVTAVRALKLHADIATGSTNDHDSEFIRKEDVIPYLESQGFLVSVNHEHPP